MPLIKFFNLFRAHTVSFPKEKEHESGEEQRKPNQLAEQYEVTEQS